MSGGLHPVPTIDCLARLTARVDQIPREPEPISVRIERLGEVPQELRDALEVVEQRQLARRVAPLAQVVALDPRASAASASTCTWSAHGPIDAAIDTRLRSPQASLRTCSNRCHRSRRYSSCPRNGQFLSTDAILSFIAKAP